MLELPHETRTRLRIRAILLTAIFIISFLECCRVNAKEVSRETITVEHVNAAIVHILTVGIPKHNIKPWPRHPLMKDAVKRMELSKAIHTAANAKGVPPMLMVVTGFREGSFNPKSEGDIGEVSMFQMMPDTALAANKLDSRCTLDTVEGSAFCCATWLDYWNKKCGNWRGSMAIYATGKTCHYAYNSRVKWLTWDRLTIAAKLRKIVSK